MYEWPWFAENGILETSQNGILLVTLVKYLSLAKWHVAVLRSIFVGAALLTLACILRETDFDSEGPLQRVERILMFPVRIIAGVIAVPVGILCVRGILRDVHAVPRLVLGTGWGWIAIAGGLLVVIGGLFDRGVIQSPHPLRWEESLETGGYLLIAISTFIPAGVAIAAVQTPLLGPPRTATQVRDAAETATEERHPIPRVHD